MVGEMTASTRFGMATFDVFNFAQKKIFGSILVIVNVKFGTYLKLNFLIDPS